MESKKSTKRRSVLSLGYRKNVKKTKSGDDLTLNEIKKSLTKGKVQKKISASSSTEEKIRVISSKNESLFAVLEVKSEKGVSFIRKSDKTTPARTTVRPKTPEYKPNQRSEQTQTKKDVVESLLSQNTRMKDYVKVLKEVLEVTKFTHHHIPDNKTMFYLTGFSKSDFQSFYEVFDFSNYLQVKNVDHETQLFILCLYLKTGGTQSDMADLFNMPKNLASRILYRMGEEVYNQLKSKYLYLWTGSAKNELENATNTVIIDCIEISTHASKQTAVYYKLQNGSKSTMSVKVLISVYPSGEINFISDILGSHLSDKQVLIESGFLKTLQPGTKVLVDEGFDIDSELLESDCFRIKTDMLSLSGFLDCSSKDASTVPQRFNIEHVFQKIRSYKYIDDFLFSNNLTYMNKYFYIIAFCVNFPHLKGKKK